MSFPILHECVYFLAISSFFVNLKEIILFMYCVLGYLTVCRVPGYLIIVCEMCSVAFLADLWIYCVLLVIRTSVLLMI